MQEIKLRGQRVDNKEWVYGVPYFEPYVGGKIEAYIIGDWESKETMIYPTGVRTDVFRTFEVIPETVGQYTGLKDKNGVEIYEGDIVECYIVGSEKDKFRAVVEFGNPNGGYSWGYQLKPLKRTFYNTEILLWVEMEETNAVCEIIGNIHDNPELLEVQNESE